MNKEMINRIIKIYRVRASVYPTPHNKIWLSSGHVSLYKYSKSVEYLNVSSGENVHPIGGIVA